MKKKKPSYCTHSLVTALRGLLLVLIGSLLPSYAAATLIFDDGGTHTINMTVNDNVAIRNGSTLNVVAPGEINAPAGTAAINTHESTINVTGGRIAGGGNAIDAEGSDIILSGTAQVIGGSGVGAAGRHSAIDGGGNVSLTISDSALVQDGDGLNGGTGYFTSADSSFFTGSGGEIRGGNGTNRGGDAILTDVVTATISAGRYVGGYGDVRGGNAINAEDADLVANISGGEFLGGHGGIHGGHAVNASLLLGNISGGVFTGGDGVDYGGSALADFFGDQGWDLTINGGIFNAGSGGIADGYLLFLNEFGSYEIDILGGLFGDLVVDRALVFSVELSMSLGWIYSFTMTF